MYLNLNSNSRGLKLLAFRPIRLVDSNPATALDQLYCLNNIVSP